VYSSGRNEAVHILLECHTPRGGLSRCLLVSVACLPLEILLMIHMHAAERAKLLDISTIPSLHTNCLIGPKVPGDRTFTTPAVWRCSEGHQGPEILCRIAMYLRHQDPRLWVWRAVLLHLVVGTRGRDRLSYLPYLSMRLVRHWLTIIKYSAALLSNDLVVSPVDLYTFSSSWMSVRF
jgi:hypothetical protein